MSEHSSNPPTDLSALQYADTGGRADNSRAFRKLSALQYADMRGRADNSREGGAS